MKPTMLRFIFAMAVGGIGGCASRSEFTALYDYYFPKRSEYITSFYRRNYDKWLLAKSPPGGPDGRGSSRLYQAFHGDSSAAHDFFHDPDRDGSGEFGETWVYNCVVLLIRLGDDRFSELLAREDRKTRELVAGAALSQIDLRKHPFPKTHALYKSSRDS